MSDKQRSKILVVDDEGLNIIALGLILKPYYEVLVATNGTSALAVAEKQAPDIILLDIIMPDMSGYDVLIRLKSQENTKNIPVIFITGLDSITEEEKGLMLGAVDYITKPFHSSIVKARIHLHLKMSGYIKMIEQLCMIDTLTELTNRRGFDVRMSAVWGSAIRERAPVGLLMIDVDNFKKYNDTYGHPQGDAVLQGVAETIKKSLNRAADLAVRWGGEEFLALLPNTDLPGTLKIAEDIRATAESLVINCANGTETSITLSIGAQSMIPSPGDTVADFIALTDKALYTAKHQGKNRVVTL